MRSVQEQLEEDFEFELLCLEVYAAYLQGMVKFNPTAKTSEFKELDNLRKVLRLNNLPVGEAHCLAATEWHRATCLFTLDEGLDDPTTLIARSPDSIDDPSSGLEGQDNIPSVQKQDLRHVKFSDGAFRTSKYTVHFAFRM